MAKRVKHDSATLARAASCEIYALAVVAGLAGSMGIQLGTNLHNDAVDSERGGDASDRFSKAPVHRCCTQ